jgi:hypothetical protein
MIAALNPPGSALLAALAAVPPTMALLAYPNRPGLLLPAGATAIASLYLISFYALPMVLVGLVWLWVHHQVSGDTPAGAISALVVGVALWLAVPAVTTVHLDPSCSETLSDGTVQDVDPATRGYPTGWVWVTGSSTVTGSAAPGAGVVAEACVSDNLVGWESAAAIAVAAASVFLSWLLIKPVEIEAEEKPGALV